MAAPLQIAKPDHDGYKKLIETVGGDSELWNKFHWNLVGNSELDEKLLRMVVRTQECLAKTGKAIIQIKPELVGEKNAQLLPESAKFLQNLGLVVYNEKTQEIALTKHAAELVLERLVDGNNKKDWKEAKEIPSLRDAFIEPKQIFMTGKTI